MLCLSLVPSRDSGLPAVDVEVRAGTGATVADLAEALGQHLVGVHSRSLLAPATDGKVWPADQLLTETGLKSGQLLEVEAVPGTWRTAVSHVPQAPTARVEVIAGPDAGRSFTLTGRSATIGRSASATIDLSDPEVSRQHAHLELGDPPVIVDDGSAQGISVDGVAVTRPTPVPYGTPFRVGNSTLVLHETVGTGLGPDAVTRTPRFGTAVHELDLDLPGAPNEPGRQHFPWAMMAMPLVLGASMMTTMGGARSMVYLLAWPLALVAGHFIQRKQSMADYRKDVAAWREDAAEVCAVADKAAEFQRIQAYEDDPDTAGIGNRLASKNLVWVRRVEDPDFLGVRVGIGTIPALTKIKGQSHSPAADLRAEIRTMIADRAELDHMPVTAQLAEARVIALVGPDQQVDEALCNLLMRLAVSHSPFDVAICAALSPARRDLEGVLRWLPHARPLTGGDASVTIGAADGRNLLDRIAGLRGDQHVICVVDEAAGIPRRTLEAVALAQPRCTFVWLGPARHQAPAATGVVVDLVGDSQPTVMLRDRGGVQNLDTVDRVDLRTAWQWSRTLSSLKDVAAVIPPDNALPGAVRLTELGTDLTDLDDESQITGRWQSCRGLRGQIGVGIDGVVSLDLREDGPHGLVAGTTGAGKSELLQSFIASLAINNPPHRLTFLLVDYKGGAAFRECADLPHTVGYITDLTPALVQRALISMNAELTWREELLAHYGSKDLIALERDHPEAAPPSMLICVDEFAALLSEVPEFIDGMVSIAQRGRSLGMHMILATQRPSGVISAQIKANTDLRIALRVASDEDSADVIETKDAATISRRTPGRAWIRRTGHGSTDLVQVAYVGGREILAEALTPVQIRPHSAIASTSAAGFGPGAADVSGPATHERTDLDRLVRTVNRAHKSTGLPDPRLPWLPALPAALPLAAPAAAVSPGTLTIGLMDDPAAQRQLPVQLELGKVGHVLVYGASGSGKSEVLRTCAAAAMFADTSLGTAGAPTLVYGIDAAGGGLSSLESLPAVGSIVPMMSLERTLRFLRMMQRSIDERNALLASHGCADVDELARRGVPVSRILVLIDNLPAVLDVVDSGNMMRRRHATMVQNLLQDGRRCGVHVIATTPQRAGMGLQTVSAFGARLVLRMTTEDDYGMLGVSQNILDPDSVPGRGLFGKLEAQIGSLSNADEDPAEAKARQANLVTAWKTRYPAAAVPAVSGMPDRVGPGGLPVPSGTSVYCAVDGDLATAVGLPLAESPLLVAGRTRSGRTSVLAGIGSLLRRGNAEMPILSVSPKSFEGLDFGALVTSPAAFVEWIEAQAEVLNAPGRELRAAILVDDLHLWEAQYSDPVMKAALEALTHLVEDLQLGNRAGIAVVCTSNSDQLREAGMQGYVITAMKRGRRAALLSPTDQDGMFFGCDVPTYPLEPLVGVGRALLADEGNGRVVQLVTA